MPPAPPQHAPGRYRAQSLLRRRVRAISVVAVALAALTAVLIGGPSGVAAVNPKPVGMYLGTEIPAVQSESDPNAVELGVRFHVSVPGTIVALRYYKSTQNTGSHTGTLWTSDGRRLADVSFAGETQSGWQTAMLTHPVLVQAGVTYVASYHTATGHYAQLQSAFAGGQTLGSSYVQGTAGVFVYGATAFPQQSWDSSAYYVDALFLPGSVPTPSPSIATSSTAAPSTSAAVSTSSSASPRPSSSSAVSSSPTPSTSSPSGAPLALTAVDGGTGYYGQFTSNTLPISASFFPLGVWDEQYVNAAKLSDYGVNMIVNPVGTAANTGSVHTVDALDDEVDMRFGPGNGFTVMQQHQVGLPSGYMRYANYGKGVAFWESDTDAAQFVNRYQDVVSADLYWGTDSDLCQASQGGVLLGTGQPLSMAVCHQASNYGHTVARVRSLVSPARSKTVWNYVEIGHPGTSGVQMPLAEIKAAVWSSVIAGARGIVYFNHSFGGSCQTQHVMFDCDPSIGATVTAINQQVSSLAPVLNSPTVTSGASVSGVDGTVKWDGTNLYVFAQGAGTASISIPCVGNAAATVLGENRSITVVGGKFSDAFADSNAVHLYRIDGGSTCGL